MDDRNNIVLGWALGAGIVALGLTSLMSKYFHGETPERPGYAIAGGANGAAAVAEVPIEALLATADVAKGEAVFQKCAACHTANAGGAAGIGPNLHGIVGRGIASGSFAYSDALKSHGGSWDWANLNAWLTSPRRFTDAANKMSFAGLSSAEDRANLMAYLNAQGSNLPMPAAPAPVAAAADAAADAAPAEGEAAVATPAH
ncbi:MAG: c-type cytochrome [Sphingopyxis sp.]